MDAIVVILLQLGSERGCKEREVGFVQYMGVKNPPDVVEKDLGCILVSWPGSDQMDYGVCGKELKHRVEKVWKENEFESFIIYNGQCAYCEIRTSLAFFTIELPCFVGHPFLQNCYVPTICSM